VCVCVCVCACVCVCPGAGVALGGEGRVARACCAHWSRAVRSVKRMERFRRELQSTRSPTSLPGARAALGAGVRAGARGRVRRGARLGQMGRWVGCGGGVQGAGQGGTGHSGSSASGVRA